MRTGRILIAAAVSCSFGLLGDLRIEIADNKGIYIIPGLSEAQAAARHAARRTARRTTRRTVRRLTALPAGCPLTGAYYYCGGVYYQAVQESGTTVYIVVTP